MVKLLEEREKAIAKCRNIRISPFKIRRIAKLLKKASVKDALNLLKNLPQRGAPVLFKIVSSAAANAKNNHKMLGDLMINNILIDQSYILKRSQPHAKGRAFPIHSLYSNITVELTEKK